MKRCKLKPFKGTLKLHVVSVDTESLKLRTKETCFYCNVCISGTFCESWEFHIIPSLESNCNNEAIVLPSDTHADQIDLSVDDIIVCIYENKWYIGIVLNVDESDIEMSFMEKVKNLYSATPHKFTNVRRC